MAMRIPEEASSLCSHSSSGGRQAGVHRKLKQQNSKYSSDYMFISSAAHSEVLVFSKGSRNSGDLRDDMLR